MKVTELLLKLEMKKWAETHKDLVDDIHEIAHYIIVFNMKHGTKFELVDNSLDTPTTSDTISK